MASLTEMVCKNCGAPLNVENAEGGVVRCGYCKSVFAVAKKETDVEAVALMRIAENELDNHDFDRAYTSYKKAADKAPDEPQAYFGMALAKNKVQYLQAVKDEKDTYLQPICYEHSGKRFTEDAHYKRALELATQRQRAYYERQGEDIDYIAGEFERLEQSGLDYDCFICVKVTDDSTKMRTSDCIDADEIYFDLRGRGYKPFFSERVVGDRSGVNYEALILYALYKSECMVVVCHDEKYLETSWVKNEYARFLRLMRGGEKDADAVTIAFNGNVIERLPGRSGKIQGIDLRRGDSFEKIAKFVEYHTPAAQAKRKEEEERKKKDAERVVRETEELKRKLEEQQREFEERDRKLRQQLEQLAKDKAEQAQSKSVDMGGMTEEDMLAMVERAQKAREERERERKRQEEEAARKQREREEAIRKEREEAEKKQIEEEIRIWTIVK